MPSQYVADYLRDFGGPMSEPEVKFLRDVQGFIEYAIRNGLSFRATMGYLSHDWGEFSRYGFDYDAVVSRGFLPRVTGFSEVTDGTKKMGAIWSYWRIPSVMTDPTSGKCDRAAVHETPPMGEKSTSRPYENILPDPSGLLLRKPDRSAVI